MSSPAAVVSSARVKSSSVGTERERDKELGGADTSATRPDGAGDLAAEPEPFAAPTRSETDGTSGAAAGADDTDGAAAGIDGADNSAAVLAFGRARSGGTTAWHKPFVPPDRGKEGDITGTGDPGPASSQVS